ncbi:hypothetical protein MYX75_06490 [Acidobacteria bacterium AH-259-A15]|nr:hypothetical protein [Acidobacteria bacterium AH-259-A15]
MAYISDESGQFEVYVRPFPNVDDGRWQISRSGGRGPVWAPDGRELFYRNGDAMMVVRIGSHPTTAGTPEVLFTGDYYSSRRRRYDIHPDGKRFLMLKEGGVAGETRQELILVQNWFQELKRLVPTGVPYTHPELPLSTEKTSLPGILFRLRDLRSFVVDGSILADIQKVNSLPRRHQPLEFFEPAEDDD